MRAGPRPRAVRGAEAPFGFPLTGWLCYRPAALMEPGASVSVHFSPQRHGGPAWCGPPSPIPTRTLRMQSLVGGDTGLAAAETKAAVPPGGQHRLRSQGCSPGAQVTGGQAFAFSAAAGRSCSSVPPQGSAENASRSSLQSQGQGGSTGARRWLSLTQIPQWLLEAPVSSSESCLIFGPR